VVSVTNPYGRILGFLEEFVGNEFIGLFSEHAHRLNVLYDRPLKRKRQALFSSRWPTHDTYVCLPHGDVI
jgi:hypothetical protein